MNSRSRFSRRPPRFSRRPLTALAATAAALTLALTGCVAGEDSSGAAANDAADGGTLNIDFATYNPLSLIIKDQGWLEETLAEDGVTVEWVQSAGSNKANENLRSGAVDIGSTAGSAALLNRANGSPIKAIDVFSQPEWSALVVGADSGITSVADLEGKSVAATKGTDPYFFLVQALEEAGLTLEDVTVEQLQHADGRTALENGSVDAWAGLDPIMAGAEQNGARLIYRNLDFNTYGILAANEAFLEEDPEQAQAVVNAYEKARAWAAENPDETARILAEEETEDAARSGGSEPLAQPYLGTSVRRLVRSRGVWLLVLAVGATLTLQVLEVFESTLEEMVVLSVFVPLLIGTGGNTGNQATTTITRALALNEDLAEAIALGHDLGHTPFGHAGEAALDKIIEGGFEHREQSRRVVEVLERVSAGERLKDAAGSVSEATGISKRELYQAALAVKN